MIPVIKIHLHGFPDFIISRPEWDEMGGYKGFLKEYRFPITWINNLERTVMSEYDYENLGEWEG